MPERAFNECCIDHTVFDDTCFLRGDGHTKGLLHPPIYAAVAYLADGPFSVKKKVVPTPGVDSTQILPP